jgi:cobalt-zinc-cadmium efflux system membrane fusion protein
VLSHQTLDRERKLRADRVTSEKDLQQAEADHRAACQQLRTLGFTEEQIDALVVKPHEQVLMEVRAPFAGEIVERTAVRGALVEAGKSLFTLADRSVMWAMLNIPESALARVKVGQTVELRVESLAGQTFTGKLTWIGAEVDERTRMARARAEVPNPDGRLKARMFAQARILIRQAEGALLLPAAAIQRLEGRSYVFVRLADDLFDARVVRLGARLDGQVEVLEGLQPQEVVAVNHIFALKSAFLISRLGAGCADD